jgi:hypothetical protein
MAILISLRAPDAFIVGLGRKGHLNANGRVVAYHDAAGNRCGAGVVRLYGVRFLQVSSEASQNEWEKGAN